MREHERNMAELITYDDMESVTKQLEEEHKKDIKVIGLGLKQICDRACKNKSSSRIKIALFFKFVSITYSIYNWRYSLIST